jgi:hypothetical protein
MVTVAGANGVQLTSNTGSVTLNALANQTSIVGNTGVNSMATGNGKFY